MNADQLRKSIETLLKPDGQPLGAPSRKGGRVRLVQGDYAEALQLFHYLMMLGRSVNVPTYPGPMVEIPGLGHVGLRSVSKSGEPTLDVSVSIDGLRNVKFKYVGRNS